MNWSPWRERWRVVDVALNAWLWQDDLWAEDQTISQHAALSRQHGRRSGCVLCRVLEWFQPGHCTDALTRGDAPIEVGGEIV